MSFFISYHKIFSSLIRKLTKKMTTIERIAANNCIAEQHLGSIKSEFSSIKSEIIARRKQQLRNENVKLLQQVMVAKNQLINLEISNGKKQIPIPDFKKTESTNFSTILNCTAPIHDVIAVSQQQQPPKKTKKDKQITSSSNSSKPDEPIDIGRLDMRVGKIIEISRHPDADSLYVEKINCGEPNPRTVVSGLVRFISIEQMENRMVIVLCNLKPAKMRGILSEAMVMCASSPDKVEVLSPPDGVVPGDLVHCDGYVRQPDGQMNPKKKIFETVAPDLMTNNELVACYKGTPLHIPGKGVIVAQTLKNVIVK